MLNSRLFVALSGSAFVISQVNLVSILTPLRPSVFALQLAVNADDFWRVVEFWGDSGLEIYRSHFAFDNVHPFIYGTFGYVLVANTSLFLSSRAVVRCTVLFALPVAGVFDLAENAAHLYLLAHQPGFGESLFPLPAICSSAKWALTFMFSVGVAVKLAGVLFANFLFQRNCGKDRAGR